jgi:hypothetical protein
MTSDRRRRFGALLRPKVLVIPDVLAGLLLLAACQSGAYSLECNQGVERDVCERVGEFGFQTANVSADRVHVEARSCSRYFDPPPDDARCWSVRMGVNDNFTVVGVTQVGDGELREAEDLFPLDP